MNKLLIVEDDPIVASIYKSRLEKEDFEVTIAADGQTGFNCIQESQPEIVLLDLMLPKMNGLDILRKIRAQPRFSKLPIIVFTSAYVQNMIDEAFLAGATIVFNKATVTPRQIIDALRKALSFLPPFPGISPQPWEPNSSPQQPFLPPTVSQTSSSKPSCAAIDAEAARSAQQAATAILEFQQRLAADDSQFQSDLVQKFLENSPEMLSGLRKITQDVGKTQDEAGRVGHLLELYRKVHALTGGAGIAGLRNISRMAAALEVLIKELYEHPKNLNASNMRTLAHSIDLLAELLKRKAKGDLIDQTLFNILVVDDEVVTRRAITYSLGKAGLKSVSAEDATDALNLAADQSFDLIFLDVLMPGMNGFELCGKIRALPTNKNTPVIFVTTLSDFKSRTQASLSGGIELIAKPFMFIELSVKALLLLMRTKLLPAANSC